jgi:DNA-binding MarR family transcriptional regulator
MVAEKLNAAEAGMVRRGGPVPLAGLMTAVGSWIERRHLELMAARGFDDLRRIHNSVFVHMPADGIRLTDLAAAAGVTKQAMGELVEELVAKGYLRREPDPTDGRAKVIVIAPRGDAAHVATLEIFADLERELADGVGAEALDQVRDTLTRIVHAVVLGDPVA